MLHKFRWFKNNFLSLFFYIYCIKLYVTLLYYLFVLFDVYYTHRIYVLLTIYKVLCIALFKPSYCRCLYILYGPQSNIVLYRIRTYTIEYKYLYTVYNYNTIIFVFYKYYCTLYIVHNTILSFIFTCEIFCLTFRISLYYSRLKIFYILPF